MHSQWSTGMLIGLPILVFLIVLFIFFSVFLFVMAHKGRVDGEEFAARAMGTFCAVIALILVVSTLNGFYPYDSSYHKWVEVSGTVQSVGSGNISDGNSMSTRFVVKIDGQDYGVDDTRAALLKPGDAVDLKCKKEYVYASEAGWACNWNQK